MYCTKCGKQIEDDSKFCIYCGCEVEEEQQSKPVKNNKKKNQSSSILGVLIVVGIPIFIGVAILVINTIVHSFDPMKYEIKDFIKVASEPQFRRTDYYQYFNPTSDAVEYCTNIEMKEGRPFKTRCSANPESLQEFRNCYQNRGIGRVLEEGAAIYNFSKMAEYTYLITDQEEATNTGIYVMCGFKTTASYSKDTETVKSDIEYWKETLEGAKTNKVSATCYIDYLKNAESVDKITECSQKNIKKLDESFKYERDKNGNIVYKEDLAEDLPNDGSADFSETEQSKVTQTNNTVPAPKKVIKVAPAPKSQVKKVVTQVQQPTSVAPTNAQQNNNSDVDDFMN